MLYRLLADAVVALHLLFVGFVILGGFAALRWPKLALLHIPAACWGAVVEASGWICPLTPLENSLRRAAGAAGYGGSFVENYLLPIVYPAGLTRAMQVALAALVVVINVLIYVCLLHRQRRSRESSATPDG